MRNIESNNGRIGFWTQTEEGPVFTQVWDKLNRENAIQYLRDRHPGGKLAILNVTESMEDATPTIVVEFQVCYTVAADKLRSNETSESWSGVWRADCWLELYDDGQTYLYGEW